MGDKKPLSSIAKVMYENIDYYWNGKNWTTSSNILVSTALTQKLMALSISIGVLTPQDFRTNDKKEYKEITQTEEDFLKKKNDKTKR